MPHGSELAARLVTALDLGSAPPMPARRPGHRVAFHWPPHPVSYGFHVTPTDWREIGELSCQGELVPLQIARTEHGVFGRWSDIWLEARGDTDDAMKEALCASAAPFLSRQWKASEALGLDGRFRAPISALDPVSLLRLLYCEDRDVAREATGVIETRGAAVPWADAFVAILRDRRHPWRRIAHWCVLDLCEDLAGPVPNPDDQARIVPEIAGLLMDAEDDYARAVFKAGTVLGGHLPAELGEEPLLRALRDAPPIGRRAAIHGLYHVAEWQESERARIADLLRARADEEPEPLLAEYARAMAHDVERAEPDHAPEPRFSSEP